MIVDDDLFLPGFPIALKSIIEDDRIIKAGVGINGYIF